MSILLAAPLKGLLDEVLLSFNEGFTSEPAVEVRVGGHLEARMWEQEAADVGEAGVDVFTDILKLLVLILFHLIASVQKEPR